MFILLNKTCLRDKILYMQVKKQDVEKLANLARLEIDADDMKKYAEQISAVLDYFAKLDSANTKGVRPMDFVYEMKNKWRADEACQIFSHDQVLAEAADLEGKQVAVPKVLENKKL